MAKPPHLLPGGVPPGGGRPGLVGELESRFTLLAEVTQPGPQEDPPVKLKNNFFTEPVEGVVEGYSLPSRHEVDPSAVMAFFYYVLFGMMLSDAAYGILTVVGSAFALKKFPDMELKMRKTLRMFLFCGISTTVWGVLFGSYFGDAIPVIAQTFFHTEITVPALWFEPLDDPMRLLIFSFGVGVAHLFTGLGVQFYQLAKQKKYADALYDVVFWYLLVGGLIVVLLSTEIFQNIAELPFVVPGPVAAVAGVLAGIGAVGILFTAGRESRNPVKRFKGALRALWGFQLFKRHPVLLPAAGPGAGHQRDFHGVQPAGRHAGRRRGGGHLLCGGVPHRPQHEHGHQPAGGLCAHQPAAVCGVLRQVL